MAADVCSVLASLQANHEKHYLACVAVWPHPVLVLVTMLLYESSVILHLQTNSQPTSFTSNVYFTVDVSTSHAAIRTHSYALAFC